MRKYLHDLYRRKDLVLYLVGAGLKAQHRNTFLGYFWWLLDPLLGALIYYFVVVVVFQRGGEDYAAYLIIGLIVWRWLSAAVASASHAIVGQAGIITQVYLPKVVFPITVTLTGLINFGFGLLVIGLFFVVWGIVPGAAVLWLPYVVLMQVLFTMALALAVAFVCVFLRDTDTFVGHLLRLWFFASPVIWREEMIPDRLHWLLDINPMAHFLAGYRDTLMNDRIPDVLALFTIGVLSAAVVVFMTYFYSRHEHRMIKAL